MSSIKYVGTNHWGKILCAALFGLMFFVMMLPSSDTADFISAQVSRNTGIYLNFKDLDLDLLPAPSVDLQGVQIEARGFPALTIGAVSAAPIITKLITGKIGVVAEFENIFGGNLSFEYGQDSKAKSGAPFDDISLRAERLHLDDVSSFLRGSSSQIDLKLEGVLKADIPNLRIDHLFAEQPSGSFSIDIQSLVIPAQTIMVNFNGVRVPQALPTFDLGRVSLQNAKLKDGNLEIPELSIGDAKNELRGKIKGTVGFQVRKFGEVLFPELNAINLTLKLVADKSFMERNQKTILGGLFILMPAGCKQETAKGTEINCLMKVNRPGDPPSFEPLSS